MVRPVSRAIFFNKLAGHLLGDDYLIDNNKSSLFYVKIILAPFNSKGFDKKSIIMIINYARSDLLLISDFDYIVDQ